MTTPPRIAPVLGILIGAPVCAEYSSGYLPNTGNPAELLTGLVVLAPLYGGTALLIREAVVRTERGAPAVLLLGSAYGVLQACVIDVSLFTEQRSDITYWSDLLRPTWVAPLGLSAGATFGWLLGHAVMSIAVPLALAEQFAGHQRGRPWLGRLGVGLVAAATALAMFAVHNHESQFYGSPSAAQLAGSLAAAVALTALAFSPFGRSVKRKNLLLNTSRRIPRWRLLLVGAVAMFVIDAAHVGWGWLAGAVFVVGGVGVALHRWSRSIAWTHRERAIVAIGALADRAVMGYLTPPAEGVTATAAFGHHTVVLATVALLGWAVLRTPRSSSRKTP